MSQGLTYESLSNKSFKIFGSPREKYDAALKLIGATWNPRLKPTAGWYISRDQEEQLKAIILKFNSPAPAPVVQKDIQPEIVQLSESEDHSDDEHLSESVQHSENDHSESVQHSENEDTYENEQVQSLEKDQYSESEDEKHSSESEHDESLKTIEPLKRVQAANHHKRIDSEHLVQTADRKKVQSDRTVNDAKIIVQSDKRGDEPERHSRRVKEPEKHSKKVEEPERHSKKVEEPERQSRRDMEPERQSRRVEEPERHSRRVKEPERQSRRVEEPERQSRRVEEPERHSRRVEEPERQSRRVHASDREPKRVDESDRRGDLKKRTDDITDFEKLRLNEAKDHRQKLLKSNVKKLENPAKKIINKSRELFNNYLQSSGEEDNTDESNLIYEKYQQIFNYYKTFAKDPKKFEEKPLPAVSYISDAHKKRIERMQEKLKQI